MKQTLLSVLNDIHTMTVILTAILPTEHQLLLSTVQNRDQTIFYQLQPNHLHQVQTVFILCLGEEYCPNIYSLNNLVCHMEEPALYFSIPLPVVSLTCQTYTRSLP